VHPARQLVVQLLQPAQQLVVLAAIAVIAARAAARDAANQTVQPAQQLVVQLWQSVKPAQQLVVQP